MSKKTAAILMAMMMASAPAGVFAAEEQVTAEQLFVDAAAYVFETPGFDGTTSFNVEGSLKMASEGVPETAFGISANGSFDGKGAFDPMNVEMKGNCAVGILGQSMKFDMEMYAVQNGDQIDSYVKASSNGEESPWEHEVSDYEGLWEEMGLSGSEDLKEKLQKAFDEIKMQLDWNIEEQDDTIEMSGVISYDEILSLMEQTDDITDMDEDERKMLEDLLKCIKININFTFDKETHALLNGHIDLDGSDLDGLGKQISDLIQMTQTSGDADGMNIAIELTTCTADMNYTYGAAPEITVPEEALQTPVDGDTDIDIDVDDLMEHADED